MKSLQGKTALITGASRGIGIFIARALAKEGMNLILAARNATALEEVAKKLRSKTISVVTVPTDITQREQLKSLVERAEAGSNGVDVLVNNAGLEIPYPFDKLDPETINQVIEVNLTAPMILTRLLLPKMIERGSGHIVNIASLAGLVGTPYEEVYAASKHGLVGFTRSLQLSVKGEGYPIGVALVSPGYISNVGMYEANRSNSGLEAPVALGTSPPEDVAKAVVSAIKNDEAEIIVNPKPVKPLLLLQTIRPSLAPWVAQKTGALAVLKGFAYSNLKETFSDN